MAVGDYPGKKNRKRSQRARLGVKCDMAHSDSGSLPAVSPVRCNTLAIRTQNLTMSPGQPHLHIPHPGGIPGKAPLQVCVYRCKCSATGHKFNLANKHVALTQRQLQVGCNMCEVVCQSHFSS